MGRESVWETQNSFSTFTPTGHDHTTGPMPQSSGHTDHRARVVESGLRTTEPMLLKAATQGTRWVLELETRDTNWVPSAANQARIEGQAHCQPSARRVQVRDGPRYRGCVQSKATSE